MALDRISGHVLDGVALKRLNKIRAAGALGPLRTITQSDRVMETLGLLQIDALPLVRRPGDTPVIRYWIGTTRKGDGE